MRLPIALALSWPARFPGAGTPMSWQNAQSWTFEPLDEDAFPAVRLAKQVGAAGGCLPAVLNAANEECVAAFLAGDLPYLGIVDTVSRVVDSAVRTDFAKAPGNVEDVLAAERWARAAARAWAQGRGGPQAALGELATERAGN
jgi:1-deoxy-D-xylulose-5-phosphate reductoisomerase